MNDGWIWSVLINYFLPDDSNGRESYTLQTTTMSWQDGQSFGRQYYTDLVSVKTTAQHKEICMHAYNNSVWIRLFRDVFMWSDGSTGSFRNWDESNPDNLGGNQNCATFRWVHPVSVEWQWLLFLLTFCLLQWWVINFIYT